LYYIVSVAPSVRIKIHIIISKLGRGSRDLLSNDLDFGAAFQCCPSAWQFAGYRLHRLMIVFNFVSSSLLNSLGIICTEGLKK